MKHKVLCPWDRNHKIVQKYIKSLSFSDKFFSFSDYFPVQLNQFQLKASRGPILIGIDEIIYPVISIIML